jgi:hypothetical protein
VVPGWRPRIDPADFARTLAFLRLIMAERARLAPDLGAGRATRGGGRRRWPRPG